MSATSSSNISGYRRQTRTISITSGKGGVGKTTMVCNMAVQLSRMGHNVLILDGDLGMANVDIMFGTRANHSIRDLFSGNKRIDEVVTQIEPRIWLLPGGSGFNELQNLSEREKRIMLDQLSSLKTHFDYMLIDTAPGIDNNVMYFNTSAQEIYVVVTPDPASFADAYALIKVLHTYHQEKRFSIIANQVRDEQEGLAVFQRLSDVSQKFLYVSLDYVGCIPTDVGVKRATKSQQLVIKTAPEAPASQSIKKMVEKISSSQNSSQVKGGIQFFWEQLMGVA
ncbi:MAG: MinD/ParA family protein [Oligoflexia bacterium]|nr:MinD/ParA family protein [Oligoflexia bacterium]